MYVCFSPVFLILSLLLFPSRQCLQFILILEFHIWSPSWYLMGPDQLFPTLNIVLYRKCLSPITFNAILFSDHLDLYFVPYLYPLDIGEVRFKGKSNVTSTGSSFSSLFIVKKDNCYATLNSLCNSGARVVSHQNCNGGENCTAYVIY